ncbi:MAG: Bax inhibitor-1/YccA family protein [Actinobacteria bacterium]|nr:Bax inhibitor-1/YccA family protein [Actinomycetota bacterium]
MSNPVLNERALGLGNLGRSRGDGQWDESLQWAPPVPGETGLDDGPVSTWDRGVMTVSGTASATLTLILLVIASATTTWFAMGDPTVSFPGGWVIGGLVVALVAALVGTFKPRAARIAGPIYALAEGVVLGAISKVFEAEYSGIVLQAVGATMAVFVVMLLLYRSRVIRVTDRFRRVVVGATLGLVVFYLLSFVLGLFGAMPSFINSASPMGILFSVFVAGLAAFNLALDFDLIERAAEARQPAHMEWYCALGVTITLVWLYLELLRLLAKLREN